MGEEIKYQNEAKLFDMTFCEHKQKQIVLYGIGRLSATIVPQLKDYNLIGLMDSDSENIGKEYFGLPVLSKEEAEQRADLIIINTAKTFWETIYKRINDIKTPVYYKNGELACFSEEESNYCKNDYWNTSYQDLKNKIDIYDIISFDIYDTLIMRKVFRPEDVWRLIDRRIQKELHLNISFIKLRKEILADIEEDSTLDEIYAAIKQRSILSDKIIKRIREIELEIEEEVMVPRYDMVKLYQETKEKKKVYLLSDMYLPKDFLIRLLNKAGVDTDEEYIWISADLKMSKKRESLWMKYRNTVIKNKKALHIGDNPVNDIKNAQKYGVDTYYVMSGVDILNNSSINGILPEISTLYQSITMGLIISKLFNSPFSLNEKKGKLFFDRFDLFGYCLFGSVIYTFLNWLIKQAKKDQIKELLFFARDGFFLEEDYQYLINKLTITDAPIGKYLAISRRLISIASINNEEDFNEVKKYAYSGTFRDYMKDRFDVTVDESYEEINRTVVNAYAEDEMLDEWMKPYQEQIKTNIQKEKENYIKYWEAMKVKDNFAVIDLWYFGNNQYSFAKFLQKRVRGYYMAANVSDDNKHSIMNDMIPCYQSVSDKKAEKCYLHKSALFVESFLTAPYGMIIKVDENGGLVCDEKKENQKHFEDRIQMNEGIKSFIDDFLNINSSYEDDINEANILFIDKLFGIIQNNNCDLSEKLKDSFYWDNRMVHNKESKIF